MPVALPGETGDLNDVPLTTLDRNLPSLQVSPSSRYDRLNKNVPWWKSVNLRFREFLDRNSGLLLIAGAQGVFSFMSVLVKKLSSLDEPVPTLELVFSRMIITYICCTSYMVLRGVPDPFLGPKGVRLLLILRGFSGFFGLFGVYFALNYLSLSDTTVLTFLGPLATTVAAAYLLHEPFSMKQALAGVFSLFGVILVARPPFLFGHHDTQLGGAGDVDAGHAVHGFDPAEKGTPAERLIAVGVSLIGVVGGTGAWICIRAIGTRAHAMHSLTSFSAYCVVASGIGMILRGTPVTVPLQPLWIGMLLLIGLLGFVSQTFTTMGIQRETAGRATMGVYVQIIFATFYERIFFHTVPSATSIAGTLIIMTSAIYIALSKSPTQKNSKVTLEDDGDVMLEEGLLSDAESDDMRRGLETRVKDPRKAKTEGLRVPEKTGLGLEVDDDPQ
ncbi:hypothetical protein JAAARDRAFT_34714 [Jaapia argillacea MUCL 33604]|uniref:EamA domain-containing protein n=1 Tax=Jaapia argillacea MUCL 33604 TaxID=933084 RepID=A0A067Q337_9AGAM|nr:hypothetical protein JAAARDRAFT_34714 [Jaapia argillacea MUCL 33604]